MLDAAIQSVVVSAVVAEVTQPAPATTSSATNAPPIVAPAANNSNDASLAGAPGQGAAANVPPVLVVAVNQNVNEGQMLDLSATGGAPPLALYIDPDLADTHTATVNWGDGSLTQNTTIFAGVGAGALGGTHVYADNGVYTVTINVADNNGGADSDSFNVTVKNVPPVVVPAADQTVDEGHLLDLSGTGVAPQLGLFVDPGVLDTHTATVNWGDGSPTENATVFDGAGAGALGGTHTYADNGTYTVTLVVSDNDGGSSTPATFKVTVNNVAPFVDLTGPTSVDEGAANNWNLGPVVDPGTDTVTQYVVHWGDGNTNTFTAAQVAGMGNTIGHTYADGPNSYTIAVDLADEDGSYSAVDTLNVTVNNVAPTLTLSGPGSTNEGSVYTLGLSSSDPGQDTITQWTINWGDTIVQTVAGNPASVTHTYADGISAFTISATATDEDGTFAAGNTVAVTVNNVPPVVDITGPTSVNEGAPNNWMLGAVVDPGTDTVSQYIVHWGDGNTETFTAAQIAGMGNTVGHTYTEGPNGYTIALDLVDEDGTYTAVDTLNVTVNNVPPVLVPAADQMVNEGQLLDLSGTGIAPTLGLFSDPGVLDTHTATVNWGDGSPTENATVFDGAGAGALGGTHTYADDGTYTVTLVVMDDDGGSDTASFKVMVKNVEPFVDLTGPTSVNEGAANNWSLGPVVDPGADTVTQYIIHWGDGHNDTFTSAQIAGMGNSIGHTYVEGPNNYTISVDLVDEDGTHVAVDSLNVTVKNVAPSVALNSVPDISENGFATLTGSYTDVGVQDAQTVTINWGDPNNGSASTFAVNAIQDTSGAATLHVGDTFNSSTDSAVLTITSVSAATGQVGFSVQHQYLDDGLALGNNTDNDISTIGVTVVDDDADSGNNTTTVTVHNVAPAVALNTVTDINENGFATLAGSYTDIGLLDAHKVTINWDDPNNGLASTFVVSAIQNAAGTATLHVGDTFSSSTDSAVLTIASINTATGQVGFTVQHQYLDDGLALGNNTASDVSTIGVTVADDDAQSGSNTTMVTVRNVAPSVALDSVTDISENGIATLTGTYTDIGLLDAHTVTVNWDDPNNNLASTFSVSAIQNAAGAATLHVGDTFNSSTDSAVLTISSINTATGQVGVSVQHQYLDDGLAIGNNTVSDTSTIGVTVADDDTQSGSNTTTVTVHNVAPSVALNSVTDINENGFATLSGSYTDIGLLDAHTLTVNWADPNNSLASTFAVSAIQNAAGTATLHVNDTFSSSTDSAILTITSIDTLTGQVGFSVQHQYLDDGLALGNNTASDTSTIGVTVNDDDTQSGSNTTTVTVHNVAPAVALNTVPDINENGVATLTGSYTDIGLLDAHTVTVNWADPNNGLASTFAVNAIENAAGTATLHVGDTFSSSTDSAVLTINTIDATTGQVGFSVQHQYLDDGLALGNNTASDTSTIGVTVLDDDTQSGSNTTTVTVHNVVPSVALSSVADINENGVATLAGSYTDIGLLDAHSVTVNWGDPNNGLSSTFAVSAIQNAAGTATLHVGDTFSSSTDSAILTITSIDTLTGQVGFTVQHQYLDDGLALGNNTSSDVSTIGVTVADDDAQSGSNTTSVTVHNVSPTVALNSVSDINENGVATLTGTYTDIGLLDAHILTVDWDDPNNSQNSTFAVNAIQNAAGAATLHMGDTFNSSTDSAVLTITSINTTTGQVGVSVQHQYLDDGLALGNNTVSDTSTIGVTVADDDTQSGSNTTTVTVHNVAPAVALNTVTDINENGFATLAGTYTDIGLLDAHSITVNWGDPNNSLASTFAVSAIQNAGGAATLHVNDTLSSSTDNAILTITSINTATGQVGFTVQHQYLDDGLALGNNTVSDTSTIGVAVADDDTQSGSNTTTVTVHNVAPSVALNSVSDINENGVATLTGSYTDIGLLDAHSLTINWADPNNGSASTFAVSAIQNAAGTATLHVNDTFSSSTDSAILTITSIDTVTGQVGFSVQHQYLDDGLALGNNTVSDTSTIGVTVMDDDTQSGSNTTTVTVHNVAPAVALNTVPDINENGVATLTGSYTDIGLLDAHTLTVNWADPNNGLASTFAVNAIENAAGTATLHVNDTFSSSTDSAILTITSIDTLTGQVGFSVQHQYLDDGLALGNNTAADTSTIGVTVLDDDTQSGSNTTTVTVHNVTPSVALNSVTDINENGFATLSGSYTDIGLLDAHTLTVNWADPNNGSASTFAVGAIRNAAGVATLHVGDTFSSSTDSAVLTINTIDATTGQVGFTVQHQYLDDGLALGNNTASDTSTIGVTVLDDDTQSGSNTTTVTVHNVAPAVALNTVPDINENGTATLTGTYTDIGLLDAHTLTVNWGDPNNSFASTFAVSAIQNAAGTATLHVGDTFNSSTDSAVLTITSVNAATGQVGFLVQHQYLDDGLAPGNNTPSDVSAIGVAVADDDTQSGSNTTTVTVHNVAPSVALNSVTDIDENGFATLSGSYTDIGLLDAHTLTVNWADPNNGLASTFAVSAIQNAAGTATLHVNDTFSSSTDSAILTITSIDTLTGQVGFAVQHQYLDDGPSTVTPPGGNNTASDNSTITVTVADDDTQSGSNTTSVTVNNVTPVVNLDAVSSINENDTATLTGTYTDIGLSDVHKLTVNWGDPNNGANSVFDIPATSTLSGSPTFTSTGADTTTTLTIVSFNATTGLVTFSVQHQYLDDGPAPGNGTTSDTSTIGVTVADDDTQSGSKTTTVTVHNVAPVIQNLTPTTTINEASVATISMHIEDPGSLDIFTTNVCWGDSPAVTIGGLGATNVSGSVSTTVGGSVNATLYSWTAATRQLTLSHLYADDANYQVVVRVADDDMTANFLGVEDPGNFVDETTPVTVKNLPPTLAGTSNLTVDEGSAVRLVDLGVHIEDVGFDNPANQTQPPVGNLTTEDFVAYSINWGDNSPTEVTMPVGIVNRHSGSLNSDLISSSVTTADFLHDPHYYADDGSYTVTVRMADDNMGAYSNPALFTTGVAGVDYIDRTFQIVVKNVTPTTLVVDNATSQERSGANVITTTPITPGTTIEIKESGTLSLTASFSDPGFSLDSNPQIPVGNSFPRNEVFRYYISWGDNQETIGVLSPESMMTLNNGAPTVATTGTFDASQLLAHMNHTYADDGTYTVTVRLADDNMGAFADTTKFISVLEGGQGTKAAFGSDTGIGDYVETTFTVAVANIDPTFKPQPSGPNVVGTQVTSQGFTTVTVAFDDPGFDNTANLVGPAPPTITDTRHETFTHVIEWGDGTVDAVHTYADSNTHSVTVTQTGPNGTITFPAIAGIGGSTNTVLTLVSSQSILTPGSGQLFTYEVDWGDGNMQTISLTLKAPGAPVINGQTTVDSLVRTSGGVNVRTAGSFAITHQYLGPPDPANPTQNIHIVVTVEDDNNGSVTDFTNITNPGINTFNVAIDTTPQVPRLVFSPQQLPPVLLEQRSAAPTSLQPTVALVAHSDLATASDRYFALVVVSPDGQESEPLRLSDDALFDLRGLFAALPDNHYKIFLYRTDNNSRRLVVDVLVRRGRVIEAGDDSEGTRDRPPGTESKQQNNGQQNSAEQIGAPQQHAQPLKANPVLKSVPDEKAGAANEPSLPAAQPADDVAKPTRSHASMRWALPLAGLGLIASRESWSERLGAALEQADEKAWQRLRRAGRLGRSGGKSPIREEKLPAATNDPS